MNWGNHSADAIRVRALEPEDYPAVATIGNHCWPDLQVTAAELAARDARRRGSWVVRRQVATRGGRVLGWSKVEYAQGPAARHLHVSAAVLPAVRRQGIGSALEAELERWLGDRQFEAALADVRAHHEDARRFLERRGFEVVMRLVVSRLDLTRFDPGPHAAALERVRAAGVRLATLPDWCAERPDAIARVHALRERLADDVPRAAPRPPMPLEAFMAYFEEDSTARPDCWVVALHGDDCVGMTAMWGSANTPGVLHTDLTGVATAWRRRGIATALKLRAIAQARAAGVTRIDTDNEERNPMLGLNLALGFVPRPAWLTCRRRL